MKGKQGYTLSELLIVVSILILILALILALWEKQIVKGRDVQRKADLYKIKKAFTEYYNDHSCYPPADTLTHCGGNQLAPYLPAIRCDPVTNEPYQYYPVLDEQGQPCAGFRVLGVMTSRDDPDIVRVGCSPYNGCGFGEIYNFGVSEGVPVPADGFVPMITPSPTQGPISTPTLTPTPTINPTYHYACTPGGDCNYYDDPYSMGCPVTFQFSDCKINGVFQCSDPANRCDR